MSHSITDWVGRHRALTGTAAALVIIVALANGGGDPTTPSVAVVSMSSAPESPSATPSYADATSKSIPAESSAASIAAVATTAPAKVITPKAKAGTALALLDALAVKGRAPKTGYTRAQFGSAWTDDNTAGAGHNGCDTRNDVLRRDLTAITLKPGSNGCAVQSGTLADPYTQTTISFVRGSSTSSAVQIDHVVALSDAWQKGAQQLAPGVRVAFANDPLNLLAVDGPTNQAKGDGDAATWLPPNRGYRCAYVARQVAVKARYRLWVTVAERDAIVRILAACPAQPAPKDSATPPISYSTPTTVEPAPQPTAVVAPPPPAPVQADTVYYQNCAAARAAGAAPLNQGDPGYRPGLDRDKDGVACE